MPVPTIASQTTASLTISSALLGATVTGSGITETGIAISQTAVNAAPVKGGSGVLSFILSPVAANGGLFTLTVSGLLPGTSYTFNAYSINATGTSTANATVFATPPIGAFGSGSITPSGSAKTIYVRLRNLSQPERIDFVTKIEAIYQPYANGTFRDVFNAFQLNPGAGAGTMAFATTAFPGASSPTPVTNTTPTSVSDEVAHVNLRQAAWLESGVLFTTQNGLPFRFWDKDIYGWSNALVTDTPVNVTT